jgi:integrase
MMPVYKDRDRWRVRIWHKGKRLDWIVEGTKKDAEAFEARKRVELQRTGGLSETRVAPTFSSFCVTLYRNHAETALKARTWKNRQYTIATLVEFFRNDKLTEITTMRAVEYQQQRLRAGIQPSTVNDEVKVLRAVLNHAHYLGVPAINLVVKDLPVRRKRRLRYSTAEQVTALLAAIAEHSPSLYWPTLFLLETGCRKGEALALQFSDVDLGLGIVRIQPNEEWQPKDNEAREIPIDKKGALYKWLKDEATSGRRFVFVSRRRDEETREPRPFAFWPQRKFDRARIAAGLVGGPHTTRHTFATYFLARVPDLYLLGKILGHSHERVTKLYAHLLPDHLERARGAVAFDAPFGVDEMKGRTGPDETSD